MQKQCTELFPFDQESFYICVYQGIFFILSLSTSAVMEMNLESGSPSPFHVRCFIEQSSADLHKLSTLFIV